jgi:hypothetical protein
LLVWLAAAIGCVALQQKFFVYHWLIAFPPLLATAGFGLSRLPINETPTRTLAVLAIAVFIVGVACRPALDTWRFTRFVVGLDSRDDYLGRFERFDYRPLSAIKAAAYIKAQTRPEERVAVYGEDATVQFLSERASPSRFVYAFPLNVPNPAYRNSYRTEFIKALRQPGTRYIVLGTHQDEISIEGFPELKELLAERYLLDTRFGLLDLYRLRDYEAPSR